MKVTRNMVFFTLLLIAAATTCKLLFAPKLQWSGFSPVYAIALFSGMIFKDKSKSFILPLVALIASDLIIEVLYRFSLFDFAGFYSHQWINYALLLIATFIGWAVKGKSFGAILGGALAAPTVFFLLSNLLVWGMDTHQVYARSFSGILACLTAGLPFYRNAVGATLIFLPAIIFAYNSLVWRKSALTLA